MRRERDLLSAILLLCLGGEEGLKRANFLIKGNGISPETIAEVFSHISEDAQVILAVIAGEDGAGMSEDNVQKIILQYGHPRIKRLIKNRNREKDHPQMFLPGVEIGRSRLPAYLNRKIKAGKILFLSKKATSEEGLPELLEVFLKVGDNNELASRIVNEARAHTGAMRDLLGLPGGNGNGQLHCSFGGDCSYKA